MSSPIAEVILHPVIQRFPYQIQSRRRPDQRNLHEGIVLRGKPLKHVPVHVLGLPADVVGIPGFPLSLSRIRSALGSPSANDRLSEWTCGIGDVYMRGRLDGSDLGRLFSRLQPRRCYRLDFCSNHFQLAIFRLWAHGPIQKALEI